MKKLVEGVLRFDNEIHGWVCGIAEGWCRGWDAGPARRRPVRERAAARGWRARRALEVVRA